MCSSAAKQSKKHPKKERVGHTKASASAKSRQKLRHCAATNRAATGPLRCIAELSLRLPFTSSTRGSSASVLSSAADKLSTRNFQTRPSRCCPRDRSVFTADARYNRLFVSRVLPITNCRERLAGFPVRADLTFLPFSSLNNRGLHFAGSHRAMNQRWIDHHQILPRVSRELFFQKSE